MVYTSEAMSGLLRAIGKWKRSKSYKTGSVVAPETKTKLVYSDLAAADYDSAYALYEAALQKTIAMREAHTEESAEFKVAAMEEAEAWNAVRAAIESKRAASFVSSEMFQKVPRAY